MNKSAADAAQKEGSSSANLKVEELLSEQQRQLEKVRYGISEDVSKIKENVQSLIEQALAKRALEKRGRGAPTGKSGELSSDGFESANQKEMRSKERERLEGQIKELEDSFKQ